MQNFVWSTTEYLKAKDVEVGVVYLFNDHRVGIYLGKTTDGCFAFYIVDMLMLVNIDSYTCTLPFKETQLNALKSQVIAIMKKPLSIYCFTALRTLPKLRGSIDGFRFDKAFLSQWITKSRFVNQNLKLPSLCLMLEDKEAEKQLSSVYVKTKDLVPGELYYTGNCWRGLYLYLGRNSRKEFCWYFVGNEDILRRNNISEYYHNMDITKSNKKVKRLADAQNDAHAYVSSDTAKLIKDNWKADLRGLNLG